MDIQGRYDTQDVAARDRFAYWRDAVCDSYVQLGCDTPHRQDFRGTIEIARHSVLSVSRVSGSAHRVDRRKRDIRAATEASFLLSLQTARTCALEQRGKEALLRPGDMALYASTDPYSLQLSRDFCQTVVQLPAARLTDRLPNAEMLTACRIDGQTGIGKLVRENILAFSQHIDARDPTLEALLQDTLIDLIATGLAAHGTERVTLSSPDQGALLRAKTFIRAHLGAPDLNRERVAAAVGLSVRRLNDIFAQEGQSLSAYIRQKRLETVANHLRDPRFARRTISELAYQSGFSNMQNFSTLFRNTYGQAPRDYRKNRP